MQKYVNSWGGNLKFCIYGYNQKTKKWSDGIGYFYVAYDPEKKSQRVEITSDINATFEQRDQEVIFQTTVGDKQDTLYLVQKSENCKVAYYHSTGMGDIRAVYSMNRKEVLGVFKS